MTEHKHTLKFIRRGVYFVGIEGWPYLITWDFICTSCKERIQVDRQAWRLRLLGKGAIPWKLNA